MRLAPWSDKVRAAQAKKETRERDGHKCVRCGATEGLQWAHVHSRAIRRLRYEPDNAMSLCGPCHRWFDANRKVAREWWESLIGPVRAARLRRLIP